MGRLGALGRHAERRFGQDISHVSGPQLGQGLGQVTLGGGGADAVRGPQFVLASPKMGKIAQVKSSPICGSGFR